MMNRLQRLSWLMVVAVPALGGCGGSDAVEMPKETVAPPSREQAEENSQAPSPNPLP